eukprot:gene18856-biopygen20479
MARGRVGWCPCAHGERTPLAPPLVGGDPRARVPGGPFGCGRRTHPHGHEASLPRRIKVGGPTCAAACSAARPRGA